MSYRNSFLNDILEGAKIYKNGIIDTNKAYHEYLKTYNNDKARELVEKDRKTNQESYETFLGSVNASINPRVRKLEGAYAEGLSAKNIHEDMKLFNYDLDKRDLEILQTRHKGNDFFQKQLDSYAINKGIEIPSVRNDKDQLVSELKSVQRIVGNQNVMDNEHFIIESLETALTNIDNMM